MYKLDSVGLSELVILLYWFFIEICLELVLRLNGLCVFRIIVLFNVFLLMFVWDDLYIFKFVIIFDVKILKLKLWVVFDNINYWLVFMVWLFIRVKFWFGWMLCIVMFCFLLKLWLMVIFGIWVSVFVMFLLGNLLMFLVVIVLIMVLEKCLVLMLVFWFLWIFVILMILVLFVFCVIVIGVEIFVNVFIVMVRWIFFVSLCCWFLNIVFIFF